ncbi:sensor domain-containing diguanylate cyclase [Aeromonas hydrophila]|uniref:Sensor domain-containing diguanylate cyclase n=1 Tax=Aeromonas hydrophila TaxID=644 RepID=A0ABD7G259_AERHY|nr:PAS domain S-box protein [Aeromonas hydrophila]MBC8673673.1 PAS domain S-box protein [Aeromonas hydrophila]MBC8689525.1 PAS domain S-box protein [Aeromonas hydrophila]MCR3952577.1 PAS domain S-box protein [Aeromonas hydrophila]RCF43997.1 sensor domain-containing diguanylate cyclase [Aeromonas hydrophila]
MIAPSLPRDEESRLERLRILGLLDREPIDQLDRLTRLITRHFSLPIAMVSLTDVNRQWFLARTGVALCEISREHSFCGHAILHPDIMQVPDARLDPRFADNPLVTEEPHVVFYAGRPLRALDGVVLGTLCLVDHAPRHLDQEACRDLDDFGRLVENTLHDLERRHQVRSLNQVLEDKDHLFTLTFNQSSVGMALSSLEGKWLRANPGLERLLGYSEQAMLSRTWHAMTHPEDLPRELPLFNALLAGQRQDYRLEKRMIRADGSQCWVQLSVTLCHSRTMAPHLIAVFADLTERKQAEAELLQLQQGLERQVRERTRELSSTVEQLHREMQERGVMQQRLWQEQRRLQHMLEHTSNAFLELDEALVITGWNPASTTLLGWHPEEMLGRTLPVLLGSAHPLLAQLTHPQSAARRLECEIGTHDGRRIPVEVIAERYQFDGKVRIALFLHDITARRQVLAEIERGRARLRAITDGLPVTISMVSPEGRYLFANQAYCRYFGLDAELMREMSVREVIGDAAYGRAIAHLERALAGEQVSFENRFELPIGPRDLRITMIPSRGDESGVYILGSDITEFKALQNQLEHEAAHDPLTGLPNRRAFTLRLSRELERVRQNAETLGLLFLDLDGFKRINDQLGHHVGDALLQRFASVLSAEVRPGDMVARLAGDEFTIILPALRQPELELPALCERLLAAMAVPADVAGHLLPLAGSIGGALCHSGQYCHIDDLLHRADSAMYQAKQAGKGRFALDL